MLRCISVPDRCGSSETMCLHCISVPDRFGSSETMCCVVFQFLIGLVVLRLCVALYFSS